MEKDTKLKSPRVLKILFEYLIVNFGDNLFTLLIFLFSTFLYLHPIGKFSFILCKTHMMGFTHRFFHFLCVIHVYTTIDNESSFRFNYIKKRNTGPFPSQCEFKRIFLEIDCYFPFCLIIMKGSINFSVYASLY